MTDDLVNDVLIFVSAITVSDVSGPCDLIALYIIGKQLAAKKFALIDIIPQRGIDQVFEQELVLIGTLGHDQAA